MIKKESKKKEKAKDDESGGRNSKWTKANDTVLIDALTQQKVEDNWGDNNPKLKAWVACIEALARSKIESSGVPKGLKVGVIRNLLHLCKQFIVQVVATTPPSLITKGTM